jgi:6-phosphogluconolactonase/glucosamine-6-phosphate isomerase/deaminase
VRHELQIFDDVDSLARGAAAYVLERSQAMTSGSSSFSFAVSGGKSPWLMLAELTKESLDWDRTVIYQVDERVAPQGDDSRNLTHLEECLASTPVEIQAMGVNDSDLDAAAASYASLLPTRFNLIHLGIGPDGHCASLIPNDPILNVSDRLVTLSGLYQGTRRMTLTYPALARGDQLLWLVSGADKQEALAKLLDGDTSIPAGSVEADASLIMADRSALKQ